MTILILSLVQQLHPADFHHGFAAAVAGRRVHRACGNPQHAQHILGDGPALADLRGGGDGDQQRQRRGEFVAAGAEALRAAPLTARSAAPSVPTRGCARGLPR